MARPRMKNPRKKNVTVWVDEDEKNLIENQAKMTGLKSSSYLRALGCNYPLKSMVDQLAVDELIRARADLGRLGGLFKKWLVANERTNTELGSYKREEINSLVNDIETEMEDLKAIALRIMRETK